MIPSGQGIECHNQAVSQIIFRIPLAPNQGFLGDKETRHCGRKKNSWLYEPVFSILSHTQHKQRQLHS